MSKEYTEEEEFEIKVHDLCTKYGVTKNIFQFVGAKFTDDELEFINENVVGRFVGNVVVPILNLESVYEFFTEFANNLLFSKEYKDYLGVVFSFKDDLDSYTEYSKGSRHFDVNNEILSMFYRVNLEKLLRFCGESTTVENVIRVFICGTYQSHAYVFLDDKHNDSSFSLLCSILNEDEFYDFVLSAFEEYERRDSGFADRFALLSNEVKSIMEESGII